MTNKEKQLAEITNKFLIDFHPDKMNGSLIELYFSFTSITQDFPIQFQAISSNIHGLIKFISQIKKVSNQVEELPNKRGRKKKELV